VNARLALLILFFTLIPSVAWAQGGDPEAMELFNQGREAITAGDYNLACSKFEASNAIDKRVGTLLNLALCEEKRTRLVRALETWKEAAELAKRLGDEREKDADEHAAALAPRVPQLTIVLPPDAPAGTKVRIEALTFAPKLLGPDELGNPIPVDPGKVSVVMISPDGGRTPKELSLAEGAKETVTFDSMPKAVDPVPGNGGDTGPDTPGGGGDSTLMIAGIVVGIVGLAGVGVSLGLGAVAKSKHDESIDGAGGDPDNTCEDIPGQGFVCDTPGALELNEDARKLATGSTVAMVIGGVALAAGVTLIVVSLTTGDDSAETASKLSIGVTPTGASARLTW
jgi:hypothetical protein